MIAPDKFGKTPDVPSMDVPSMDVPSPDLPMSERPLNARSLALSVLLGSHPPALPARSLVSLAELFGIAPGTMRTALSRLVASGDLAISDRPGSSWYHLSGELLHRQRSQDAARHEPPSSWDRTWHIVVAAEDQRALADRRQFRAAMANHRFGELRPDIWMRPANAPAPTSHAWIVITGPLSGRNEHRTAAQLWDLTALATDASALIARLETLREHLDWADTASIPTAFTASANVVRFLRSEPQLPIELRPPGWPMSELRLAYDQFEQQHLRLLHTFLTSLRTDTQTASR
jgi:phenylacetic acid degradation operon negative regulatory protein